MNLKRKTVINLLLSLLLACSVMPTIALARGGHGGGHSSGHYGGGRGHSHEEGSEGYSGVWHGTHYRSHCRESDSDECYDTQDNSPYKGFFMYWLPAFIAMPILWLAKFRHRRILKKRYPEFENLTQTTIDNRFETDLLFNEEKTLKSTDSSDREAQFYAEKKKMENRLRVFFIVLGIITVIAALKIRMLYSD